MGSAAPARRAITFLRSDSTTTSILLKVNFYMKPRIVYPLYYNPVINFEVVLLDFFIREQ